MAKFLDQILILSPVPKSLTMCDFMTVYVLGSVSDLHTLSKWLLSELLWTSFCIFNCKFLSFTNLHLTIPYNILKLLPRPIQQQQDQLKILTGFFMKQFWWGLYIHLSFTKFVSFFWHKWFKSN